MTENWKKEMAHKPTKEYYEAMKDLINTDFVKILGKEMKILEIGVRTGISTHAFLESTFVKHLTSVDKLDCPLAQLEVVELNRMDDWKFHKMESKAFFHSDHVKGEKYDLVYIDGSHIEVDAASDMRLSWLLLNEPGVMMTDDVQHEKAFKGDYGYGVARAFWGMMYGQKRKATFYPTQNGLAYIIK